MTDYSRYPGLFKMCGYCSKKVKQDGLRQGEYYCLVTDNIVFDSSDNAMMCNEFDGANLEI